MGIHPVTATQRPEVRGSLTLLGILTVGLAATVLAILGTIEGFYLLAVRDQRQFGYVLCGAAIAGPLFGAIAGSSTKRWSPLVTGCALSVAAFAAIAIAISVTSSEAGDALAVR
jgi:hypothetical protein